jgi:MazG family protein
MDTLRDPIHGCPWDKEQTRETILPYTIEEVYELAEAIGQGDPSAIRDELGDLLFQIVFYARMASEAGQFDFADVADSINTKLRRRHPHVFGNAQIHTADQQSQSWEQIKADERAQAGHVDGGLLDTVSSAMPALMCANKLQKKAATVGFDWGDPIPVLDKIEEEIGELRAALAQGADPARLQDETGDILFACVNLARHVKVDPETALMSTNRKFRKRFAYIESALAKQGRTTEQASLEEMEALWQQAKGT